MSPAPVPKPPAAPAKGNLSKWLAGHKWEAGLGAGGIVVTVYLAYRSRQNSASGSGSSSGTSASQALPASYYPPTSGGGDGFANELGPILSQLSTELQGAGSSGSSSPYTLPSGETLVGSGYGFGPSYGGGAPSTTPVASVSGTDYAQIESSQIGPLSAGGTTVYYEPAPGVFDPIPAGAGEYNLGGLAGNTPLYVQQK